MEKRQRNTWYLLLGLLSVLMFSACNGVGGKTTIDKNERINQRLTSYVSARKHSNLGQLQQLYLKPEQARIGKIIVKECKIVAINIEDDGLHAETKLKNKIQAMGFTFDNVPLTVKWVWNVDDWYVDVSKNSENPFLKNKSTR